MDVFRLGLAWTRAILDKRPDQDGFDENEDARAGPDAPRAVLVLGLGEEHISATAETLLMFGARQVHVDNLIRPALTRGEWVLCDRFTDATHAYQGGGRGVDRKLIEQIAHAVHGDLNPDCTLLLDVPVRVGLERMQARRGAVDRFEIESSQFFDRVRNRYLELAKAYPNRFRVIDATAKLDQVCDAAVAALDDCLGLPPAAAS